MSKMQGQVYIFDFGDKIKVGFSTDVQKRLRTIELSSGVKAKQVYAVDGSREIESIIHSWLDNRLEGEFFAYPFNQAKTILNDIVQGTITEIRTKEYIRAVKGHIVYKFDVLQALKEKGYNTNRLRKEKLLAEGVIQSLREGKAISFVNLANLCMLLKLQPGDILTFVPDEETE